MGGTLELLLYADDLEFQGVGKRGRQGVAIAVLFLFALEVP